MRVVYPDAIRTELAFAEAAAKWFTENPHGYSYADGGDIEPDSLLALRWGAGDDCVLVLSVSDHHTPTIYGQVIDANEAAKAQRGMSNVVVPREDLRKLVDRVLHASAAQSALGGRLLFSQRWALDTAERWAPVVGLAASEVEP